MWGGGGTARGGERMAKKTAWIGVVAVACLGVASAEPPQFPTPPAAPRPAGAGTLPIGATANGAVEGTQPTLYPFQASSAGILTVVVRGGADVDLVLEITDGDGQALPDSRSDRDLGGMRSSEQVCVTLPSAGTYQVSVSTLGSGKGAFRIGASWLPYPELAAAPDPDGRPSAALPLTVGQSRDDSVAGPSGDAWDWFIVRADAPGMLTVLTRSEAGDLVLESFASGNFRESTERSDQDIQGQSGNEAITIPVQAGTSYLFRVAPLHGNASPIAYRISAGLIPQ